MNLPIGGFPYAHRDWATLFSYSFDDFALHASFSRPGGTIVIEAFIDGGWHGLAESPGRENPAGCSVEVQLV
jgi:hypothetical protein